MSSERDMRKRVVAALRDLDAISIENGVGAGTPDVNYADGWIELKSLADWPAGADTPVRVPCFTPQQRVWLARRERACGACWLLLKVGNWWGLMSGGAAAKILGRVTRFTLNRECAKVWLDGLVDEELCEFLKDRP